MPKSPDPASPGAAGNSVLRASHSMNPPKECVMGPALGKVGKAGDPRQGEMRGVSAPQQVSMQKSSVEVTEPYSWFLCT